MPSKIRSVDAFQPNPVVIQEAADIIRRGGVVVFPTTCLYGIATNAYNEKALESIYAIKRRPLNKPILILIHSANDVENLVEDISRVARKVMSQVWPGQVTVILNAKKNTPELLTAGQGKIGIRVPKHKTAMALVEAVQIPITGTSANISGQRGGASVAELDPALIEQVDLILDAGPLKGGVGSTVIDLTTSNPQIIRAGIVPEKALAHLLHN